jgi:hypothetical protein
MEAAQHLGLRNALLVRYHEHGPFPPFEAYAAPLRAFDRIVWSVVGASGDADVAAREAALDLAWHMPNLTGVIMDDFFRGRDAAGQLDGAISPEGLTELRTRLRLTDRTLDLWTVLYSHEMDDSARPYLDLCDVVTFWVWKAEDLAQLPERYAQLEALTAGKRTLLGCYMWDYGNSRPMPLASFQRQCAFGQELLRTGRIEGMILLASCVCDLGLDTVEWAREWIARLE